MRRTVRAPQQLVLGALLVGLFGAAGGRAAADEMKVHLESAVIDKLPELKTYVSLLGADNKPILVKSGFKLFRDDVEIKDLVTTSMTITEAKEPVDAFVVVQVSSVMEPVLKDIKRGIEKLAKTLNHNPDSHLGLIAYAAEAKKIEALGRPMEVARELDRLTIDADATEVRMVDGARLAIDLLREQQGRRKLLVLFSDGIDAMQSKDAYDSIGKRAREGGIVVDTIGYGPYEPGRLRTLIDISRLGGGTSRGVRTPRDITDRFAEIGEENAGAYIIRFQLTESGDGQPHQYQVAVRQGKDDIKSEPLSLTLPAFTPAEPLGWPWYYWVLCVAGGLLGLVIILAIIGTIMNSRS
jgi:hypothetical protein